MNASIEKALKAYLTAQLTAANVTIGDGTEAITVVAATISGKSVSLHTNVAKGVMPLDRSWIVIGVPDCPRVVGRLHQASVMIAICTPAEDSGITEDHHRAIVAAVRACFPDMPSLYNAVAAGEAGADAKLTAALAKVAACGTALATEQLTISATSPWFMDGARDGVLRSEGKQPRWEAIIPIQMAVQQAI